MSWKCKLFGHKLELINETFHDMDAGIIRAIIINGGTGG